MDTLKDIQKKAEEVMPPECGLTKVEMLGPEVLVYLTNIKVFYDNPNLIRNMAAAMRKRVLVRCDPSVLKPPEEAMVKIKTIVPADAGISNIAFDPEFSEVAIDALKPGLVIGKHGATLKSIILETGWTPNIMRTPMLSSETISGLRASMLAESKSRKKFLNSLGKKICEPVEKSEWVKATMLGGFKEVGRSSTFIQTQHSNVLIDCGINPDTWDPSNAYPYLNAMNLALDQLDAVILSHAHLDHSGFIPYLFAYGFDGPIYCTPPTRDLMALLCFDYLDVIQKQGGKPPYGIKDVRKAISHCVVRQYHEVTDITPEIKLTFHNSGHILGSAIVHLHIGEGLHNLVYTSDFKYGYTKLFEPADSTFPRVETMFMESTYGARDDVLPRRQESDAKLMSVINETLANKGKVIIPVFSVGRAQELMLVLEENKLSVPCWLDGMTLEATAIHTVYPEFLKHNVQRRILSNDSPFASEIFRVARGVDRKTILEGDPCVILASSGMLSGGPSLEYFKMMANDPKSTIIFVGYQAVTSLGRKVQSGLHEVPVLAESGKLEPLKIAMRTETVEGYSGHSDRNQLINFARNMRPKPERIFCMHGDNNKTQEMARVLNHILKIETRAPMNLDAIRLR